MKYPDRIPVVVERSESSFLPNIDKNKFLVPNDLSAFHFIFIIRKRLQLPHTDSLFLFVNGKSILKGDHLMAQVYAKMKQSDGFLYITYSDETVLGSAAPVGRRSKDREHLQ